MSRSTPRRSGIHPEAGPKCGSSASSSADGRCGVGVLTASADGSCWAWLRRPSSFPAQRRTTFRPAVGPHAAPWCQRGGPAPPFTPDRACPRWSLLRRDLRNRTVMDNGGLPPAVRTSAMETDRSERRGPLTCMDRSSAHASGPTASDRGSRGRRFGSCQPASGASRGQRPCPEGSGTASDRVSAPAGDPRSTTTERRAIASGPLCVPRGAPSSTGPATAPLGRPPTSPCGRGSATLGHPFFAPPPGRMPPSPCATNDPPAETVWRITFDPCGAPPALVPSCAPRLG